MKAIVNIKQLVTAIAIAGRSCQSGKAVMPILSTVRVEASKKEQRLFFACSNLETRIETSCSAVVDESGAFCVNMALFTQIMRALPSEEVELNTTRTQVSIVAGRSHYRLHIINSDEFPPAPQLESDAEQSTITFKQEDLLARLFSVAPAQSEDEARYILSAVYMNRQGSSLKLVATDGRRLHINTSKHEEGGNIGMLIPKSSITKLMPLLMLGESATLLITDRKFIIKIDREEGAVTFYSKVVEGSYPMYQKVIPDGSSENLVEVVREDLEAAISRVALSTPGGNSPITITLSGNLITLSAASPEFGEAKEDVVCQNPNNVSIKIAVAQSFMIQALRGCSDEKASIKFSGEVSPIVLHIGSLLAVIMPIRLS